MVLDRIKKVNDIKQLNEEELAELQEEIRDFLVENIAKTDKYFCETGKIKNQPVFCRNQRHLGHLCNICSLCLW